MCVPKAFVRIIGWAHEQIYTVGYSTYISCTRYILYIPAHNIMYVMSSGNCMFLYTKHKQAKSKRTHKFNGEMVSLDPICITTTK